MLPTAPIPVHTAYAVPKGSVRSASAISEKLKRIATAVAAVGQNLVSPSEYLSPSAQAISSKPAPSSASHPLMASSSAPRPAACRCRIPGQMPAFVRLFKKLIALPIAMFARQACDSEFSPLIWHLSTVAKLQRGGDSVTGLSIRGADEYAAYRERGAQRQG